MSEGKIIRDVVHSDIVFEQKFFDIVDTAEFQRLNRIKQLSCEYLVFPGATHTRLAHSIGCYYVMEKLIEHFSKELRKLGYEVKERERELALCAALIHDIGHGPFSHSFEHIFHLQSHEEWAVSILKDEKTQVHQTICRNFGEDFLEALTDLISKEYGGQCEDGILSVISTLVSSQVDADRMDYLLRDSYFTAVSNGNYDLDRLIRSLGVEKSPSGNFTIFIREKFMATLEEYILARYYMHKEVYQHSVKKQMEGILRKIFQRASELLEQGQPLFCHPVLCKLLFGEEIDVGSYLLLDDNLFLYHLLVWQESEDEILRFLSISFLNRDKFEKFELSVEDHRLIENFQKNVNKVLCQGNKAHIEDFSKAYFYMEEHMDLQLYVNTKENIWIKCKDGKLWDLAERSAIINKYNIDSHGDCRKRIYFSRELFQMIYGIVPAQDLSQYMKNESDGRVSYEGEEV